MPSISMNNSKFTEEIAKEGTGASSLHPEGKFDGRVVAIEYCEMDNIIKKTANPFLYFHWRTAKGVIKDFCTLSPKAPFQLANRVKALGATVSNASVINYPGIVGRICNLEISHKQIQKSDGTGTFTVAEIKYFNIAKTANQQLIDISNKKYENVSVVYDGYELKAPETFDSPEPQSRTDGFDDDTLPF